MLFNKDYLFLHIPRTAGKCVKSSVIPFMENPIFLCQKQLTRRYFGHHSFKKLNPALVHCTLEEFDFLIQNNDKCYDDLKDKIPERNNRFSRMVCKNQHLPDIKSIENIIVCLRNPLERARSLYKFDFFRGKTGRSFDSYTDYLIKNKRDWTRPFCLSTEKYFVINDKIPENVKFIKFESLEQDLCKLFNVEKINVAENKHNQIQDLNLEQQQKLFKVKDPQKVILNINKWEDWSIQMGLLNPITEMDLLIK